MLNEQCGRTIEQENGEEVTPCRLPKGHAGNHRGFCMGSTMVWNDKHYEPQLWQDHEAMLAVQVLIDKGYSTEQVRQTMNDYKQATREPYPGEIDRVMREMHEASIANEALEP